jgi:Fic family protein
MSERENRIMSILEGRGAMTSAGILREITGDGAVSAATIKRDLAKLVSAKLLVVKGRARTTRYELSPSYKVLRPIDVGRYYEKEIDEREIHPTFNWELLRETLPAMELFFPDEMNTLLRLQREYADNISSLSASAFRKEQERLAIDLSWKSSQIEGNTYSLLETERLLKEKQTAAGRTKEEAIMLLNHKDAIDFIVAHADYLDPLSVTAIENIHQLLVKDLDVDRNIRSRRVGISGTNYQPIDNAFQVKEAMEETCALINGKKNVFEKALLALVLISYIQPFMDGNKRTARIVGNAMLIRHNHCPLSFRTVDSVDYKKAMLIFYEQNSLSPFKRIFIEQFEFAVNTYF